MCIRGGGTGPADQVTAGPIIIRESQELTND